MPRNWAGRQGQKVLRSNWAHYSLSLPAQPGPLPAGTAGLPVGLAHYSCALAGLEQVRGRRSAKNEHLYHLAEYRWRAVRLPDSAARLIWLERRLLALWQDRYGPNRVGPFGLLQVVADMIKIFTKEDWIPPFADRPVFILAPAVILHGVDVVRDRAGLAQDRRGGDLNIGLLFFLAMSSLSVYSVMLAGWASNSKYSLIGGMRAAAQMLSYEVFMGLSLMGVVIMAGSFNMRDIVEAQRKVWFFIPQILGLLIFLIAGLAETHRLPFDLPEAESELIAGYHSEYSGMKFGMFFVGEYLGIVLISALIVTLFFGGWLGPILPPIVWFCSRYLSLSVCLSCSGRLCRVRAMTS